MEKTPLGAVERPSFEKADGGRSSRRSRRNEADAGVRYFLPRPGSSPAKPELGEEVESEGAALIQAFRNGQPFYTVTVWKAVPEVNGGGSPVNVKQAVAPN